MFSCIHSKTRLHVPISRDNLTPIPSLQVSSSFMPALVPEVECGVSRHLTIVGGLLSLSHRSTLVTSNQTPPQTCRHQQILLPHNGSNSSLPCELPSPNLNYPKRTATPRISLTKTTTTWTMMTSPRPVGATISGTLSVTKTRTISSRKAMTQHQHTRKRRLQMPKAQEDG